MIPQQQQQQQQALKRQLQFSSIKPVCGDYHRFSNDPVHGSFQEPPGIVVKTPVSFLTVWHKMNGFMYNVLLVFGCFVYV